MGSVPPELSLDFRLTFVPKTITSFLKEVSLIGNVSDKVSKLDAFVKRLEEEMRKIDAFKRELPLCMLLLNDAIVALKEQLVHYMSRNVEPVLEEFIPLNNKENDQSEEEDALNTTKKEKHSNSSNKDKKNWMSYVQLWNTYDDDNRSADRKLNTKRCGGDSSRNREGATSLMPFKAKLGFGDMKEEKEEIPVRELTLSTPGIKNLKEETCSTGLRISCSRPVSSSVLNGQLDFRSILSHHQQQQQQQNGRKQRRSWSPELHRRFVNALHQLGGSQVATPKQIRERMQVDGLTNDEVKSHLQYFISCDFSEIPTSHKKSHGLYNQSCEPISVLGTGPWMDQDQYGDSSKGSSSQSNSPQGPLQLATNTGGNSTPGGDSMEDDEDTKSESCSWKNHIHKLGKDDV